MDAINKRVVDFYEQTGKSKREFATGLGVSPSIMSHVSSGRNKVGLELIQKIITAYPTVSAQWLLSGKGTMYAEDNGHKIANIEQELTDLRVEMTDISNKLSVFKRNLDKLDRHFD